MANAEVQWNSIENLLNELVEFHQAQLLKTGRRIIPRLTPEDTLQPNDYPELEFNPHFRYEEGILAGIQTVQMAFQALKNSRM